MTNLPKTASAAANVEIVNAARRARDAFEAALASPGDSSHRVALSNALNYIETIVRQEAAIAAKAPKVAA